MRHGSVLVLTTLVLAGTFGDAEARAGRGFRFNFGKSASPAVAAQAKPPVSSGRGGLVILPGVGTPAAAAAVTPAAASLPTYLPPAAPSVEPRSEPLRPTRAACASSMRFGEGQGFCAIN